MFRKKMTALAVLVSLMLLVAAVPAQAAPFWKGSNDEAVGHGGHGHMQNWRDFGRLFGLDRFGTSVRIDEDMYPDQVQNVVLASGNGYADALSASVLAHQQNAPIVLVNNGVKGSAKALAYVKEHLVKGGHVFIVGGRGVVTYNLAQLLRQLGYVVTRLGGVDRYQTDTLVAQQLNVPLHTPIILASGENYPDALGISSVAASNGWPILLSGPNVLPQSVRDFVYNDQPSQTYIIGGTGVISTKVQEQVQSIAPGTAITRLGGADRFATLADILFKFFPDPTQIYVANGYGFADALAGSPLAANHNAPILLVNPNSKSLPPAIVTYLLMLQAKGIQPQVATLGGTAAVPDEILQDVANILNGQYPQGGGVPIPATISETLTVSNPSTAGFTVSLSPALNGLTSGNFTLLNSSGSAVPITSAATGDNGATYSIAAALTAGQTYAVTASDTGYAFGGTHYVTVPAAPVSVTTSVYGPSTTGFTLDLSPAVPGLTANNFTLLNSAGSAVPIASVSTAGNGAAYGISAALTAGQTYTVTTSDTGYTFGTAQSVVVPQS
ncbi:Putative cell wall binding repeat 2 [Acididesulfobacillus acetoxydans]|uniref:Cell wall binding repeat 2 n=1 Tax=Acididesulfobacillus acetoxydans TaxID=1561005 RepID=A0A8S0WKT5_9FIRM|nr:cell wall-binding repeat-containing protein [Acididesulfobacillus acetoxydans]CAA7599594.1 Putative cell wall binding repeat 2 [Acididesulfobacillus acetoxydans]CEJ07789.1 Cell wall binding repeat 2 protein [Acididesulfobacillus acetoxydans]